MGTAISFLVLLVSLLYCLINGLSTTYAIILTLVAFIISSLFKGYSLKQVLSYGAKELPKVLPVVRILFLVGILTGLWRSSGTIAYFLVVGMRITPPSMFVLLAFLLCAILSYLLGSAFAVSSTAGVILMALARSGNVNPALIAGAVLAGAFFGDRGAPTSSSAALVASLTGTDIKKNVGLMMKTGAIPYAITLAIYTLFSLRNPLEQVDQAILNSLSQFFTLNPWALLPAVLMLVLPLVKVKIWIAMAISALSAFVLTILMQGYSLLEAISYAFFGYRSDLLESLSGGGVSSMFMGILLIIAASMLSGILNNTKVLDRAKQAATALADRLGLFPAMAISSALSAMVFCNQTVSAMLPNELLADSYSNDYERAMDTENSGILLAALVPWSIACSVPLDILGAGLDSLLFAFSLYLVPVIYLFTKKLFYR